MAAALSAPAGAQSQVSFRRGDVNVDGAIDLGDPVTTLHFLFKGMPPALDCQKAADANDDGSLAIDDAVYLLLHLFAGGRAPAAPYSECGSDPSADALPCNRFSLCDQGSTDGLVRGRVMALVVWPLLDEELADFTAEELDVLRRDGVEIEGQEARSRPLPLSGKFLTVDGVMHMLSRDGYVTLPARPAPGTFSGIEVFWELTDAEPVATIDLLGVAPLGQEPPETLLELTYRPPPDMNPPGEAGGGDAGGGAGAAACPLPTSSDGCPLRYIPPECPGTNKVPCCEDYLGPAGDGTPRWRFTNPNFPECEVDFTCKARAYRNFVGSKCYEWVFNKRGKPCWPETVGEAFGGCWKRHKYRNCQNMDEDELSLTVSPAAIKFGEKAKLTIVNNTAANSTTFRIEPDAGKGELKLGAGAPQVTFVREGGGWRLDHWNDVRQEHYEGIQLEYTAPDKDARGKCVATYRIIAEADGLTKEVEIRVMPKRNAWQGTTKRMQISDFAGLHNEVITDAIVLFDIDAGTVSGTAIYTETQTAAGCRLTGSTTAPIVPRAENRLEVDFTQDPPTFRGSGVSDFTVDLTIVCPGGGQSTGTANIPHAPWLDTFLGGRDFFTADDGCTCADTNDAGVFGASHITFEWDLKKLPDP